MFLEILSVTVRNYNDLYIFTIRQKDQFGNIYTLENFVRNGETFDFERVTREVRESLLQS